MPGPGTNVPDKVTDSHRKASAVRPVTYETYAVASQKQLKGPRITRKGDPHFQVTPPTSEMMAGGRQCTHS